jgi:hypothetical protein
VPKIRRRLCGWHLISTGERKAEREKGAIARSLHLFAYDQFAYAKWKSWLFSVPIFVFFSVKTKTRRGR